MEESYKKGLKEVIKELNSNIDTGLSAQEVQKRQIKKHPQ